MNQPIIVSKRFDEGCLFLEDYLKTDGFRGFIRSLELLPQEVRLEIKKSKLRGRGGAAFPTGIKMETAATYAPNLTERFVICNADEGEPGTFKDRYILERDPFALMEGMLIAGYAIGAKKGFIYVRGEYRKAIKVLEEAIKQLYQHNWLGKNIQSTGFDFDIDIFVGAGSYLCGEELTLIESLEGKRGHPRIKPPFPAQKGLWGMPTLVNNVETLVNLPFIMLHGADVFASIGTAESAGTKLLCLSGHVVNPGLYEVPFGVTFRDVIFDLAGGVSDGKELKAILVGGAAGNFISPDLLDLPIAYEKLSEYNLTLGSGAIMVMNETVKLEEVLRSILAFFKHESCGKCTPCRVGTSFLVEKAREEFNLTNLKWLVDEALYMAKNSLCPLGQSPIIPLRSYQKFFVES
ncbi:MAG: SLBB domain-containing protein [Bacteroidales bacterium]|nr:SLBB domain-containing protein [Bacteroidales bacterium]